MRQVTLTKQGGRVSVDADLDAVFSTLRNGVYTITIKRRQEQRTIPQNDLMWLWLTCIERETGTPKEDVYLYYCKKFLMKQIAIGERRELVYTSSSKLNTEQMKEFLTKIQVDAAVELGITLPDPDDLYWEAFFQQFK